jgi:hypothetical protein
MKLFTQLALVTAIATSGSAFAMQTMDDSALSSTTGQDGITLLIAPPLLATPMSNGATHGIDIGAAILHDKDGLDGVTGFTTGASSSGAIVLGDPGIASGATNGADSLAPHLIVGGSTPISVRIDASGNAGAGQSSATANGAAPVLNISVGLPTDFAIQTGNIYVAGSNRVAGTTSAAVGGTIGTAVKVFDNTTIVLAGAKLNIQLGNAPQGATIAVSGTINGGLSLLNSGITDSAPYSGSLNVGQILVTDAGGTNLTIAAGVHIVNGTFAPTAAVAPQGGLLVTLGNGTANSANYNVMLQNVTLGTATSTLGDLELRGVNLTGTSIIISGH